MPKTVKDTFIYQLSDEITIDLGNISDEVWEKLKADTRIILKTKQTDEIGIAYIAAFILYLYELDIMSEEFDPKKHLFQ